MELLFFILKAEATIFLNYYKTKALSVKNGDTVVYKSLESGSKYP